MCITGASPDLGQFVVSAKSVTHEVPVIITEELQCVLSGTGLCVIVKDDRQAAILPGPENPHVGFCLSLSVRLMQYLYGCFIPHEEFPGEHLAFEFTVYRPEKLLCVIDHPVGEGGPADFQPIEVFPVFLLPVERIAVAVFLIHDPCNGRSGGHSLHHVGLAVLSLHYIRKGCSAFFAFRAPIITGVDIEDLDIPGNDMDLLAHKLLPDFFKRGTAKRAGAFSFVDIEVYIPLPAVRVFLFVGLLLLPGLFPGRAGCRQFVDIDRFRLLRCGGIPLCLSLIKEVELAGEIR